MKTPRKGLPWQRLLLSIIGIALVGITWHVAIQHLYTLKPEAFAPFTTLTINAQYIIGAIVIFMITGHLVYDWKMTTEEKVVTEMEKKIIRRPRDFEGPDIE